MNSGGNGLKMTNKDAFLKLLFNYYLVDENGKGKHDELVEQIKNALESLDIILNYGSVNSEYGWYFDFNDYDLSKEELEIVNKSIKEYNNEKM